MKVGRTLTELATEIERRRDAKKDYLVPANYLRLAAADDSSVKLCVGDNQLGINATAHGQIQEYCDIPPKYYRRMLADAPRLLAVNVNQWLVGKSETRMVRTLDGQARALLSDGYRRLENEELAETVLPVLADLNLDIMSCQITDRRLYIKAVDSAVTRELKAQGAHFGDGGHTIVKMRIACPAITIANSEIGEGRLSVLGGLYDGFCSNLASFGERSLRKTHVGKRHALAAEDELFELLSDETKKKTDEALWLQVRDTVKLVFDRAKFDALVDRVEGTIADKIEGDPVKVVALTAKKFGATEEQGKSVLRHLIEGGSLSRFGLYNAVTRMAQDVEDYDEATRFESVGGKIVELPRTEWTALSQAA
jgi:hypothetical protein